MLKEYHLAKNIYKWKSKQKYNQFVAVTLNG